MCNTNRSSQRYCSPTATQQSEKSKMFWLQTHSDMSYKSSSFYSHQCCQRERKKFNQFQMSHVIRFITICDLFTDCPRVTTQLHILVRRKQNISQNVRNCRSRLRVMVPGGWLFVGVGGTDSIGTVASNGPIVPASDEQGALEEWWWRRGETVPWYCGLKLAYWVRCIDGMVEHWSAWRRTCPSGGAC